MLQACPADIRCPLLLACNDSNTSAAQIVTDSDLMQLSLPALQACLAECSCAMLLDMRDSNESASSRVFEATAGPPLLTAGWPAHSSPATGQSNLAAAAAASLDLPSNCPLADLGSSAGLLLECPDALPAAAAGEAGCPMARA